MPQIYLFTGTNAYGLVEARRRWISEFTSRHGEVNLLRVDSEDVEFVSLLTEVSAIPFASEKRLVVIEGVPKLTKEEIVQLRSSLNEKTVLLFIAPELDRRLATTKELLKVAEVREFPKLTRESLKRWAKSELPQGTAITDEALEALLTITGDDQWALASELRKLALFRVASGEIREEDVRALAVPSGEVVVWRFTDFLAQGKTREAMTYLEELLQRGHDPQSLWNIFLWMLRNLVTVALALLDGERNAFQIARSSKIPPMTCRALIPLAGKVSLERLHLLVSEAIDADISLKTGVYRATGEEPEELLALLDRFVLRTGELTASKTLSS